MFACECYELQNLTPCLAFWCVLSATSCETMASTLKEKVVRIHFTSCSIHTLVIWRRTSPYRNYHVRIQLLLSLRIRNINACTSPGILFPHFPSFSACLITVLWYFSSGVFSSYQYAIFRSKYLNNCKNIFDLKFIHAAVFQLNKINSTLAVIGSWIYHLFIDQCLQTMVRIRRNYNLYCGLMFMI